MPCAAEEVASAVLYISLAALASRSVEDIGEGLEDRHGRARRTQNLLGAARLHQAPGGAGRDGAAGGRAGGRGRHRAEGDHGVREVVGVGARDPLRRSTQ
jgi:hypothetical protein